LRQRTDELERLNVRPVTVTFETGATVRRYIEETQTTWPVLVDDARVLYQAYGMSSLAAWRVWGPASAWAYIKEALRGRLPRIPGADTSQAGGNVLIDPEGILRLVHAGRDPADRLPVERLLAVVRTEEQGNGTFP